MSRLVWRVRPKAKADIDGILDFLAERNLEAAVRFSLALEQTFDLLCDSPLAGVLVYADTDEYASVRRWPVHRYLNYVVYYVAGERVVDVVRVLHGARHREQILREQ